MIISPDGRGDRYYIASAQDTLETALGPLPLLVVMIHDDIERSLRHWTIHSLN